MFIMVHQIHISLPINKLLDAGVAPQEIPLPHELLFNQDLMANIDPTIMQWQITDVVKEQDWLVVLRELDSMPDSFKGELQWQYWYARALIATKKC
jgi:hypothetical protein